MRRLVYSPKAYAYVRTEGFPNGLDISEYIVSGEVNRVVNEVSTATVTLRNPNKRFTQIGKPVFRPMDPITIFLARYQDKPVQVFTGFLDRTPYYQLFPGTCTIQASCTLKRLLHTYWDPALPYTRDFLKNHGWLPFQDGSIVNLEAEQRKTLIDGSQGELNDSGFGNLLLAILLEVGNWRHDEVYIEKLPENIVDDMVEMYKAFSKDNEEARQQFNSLLKQIIGANASGGGDPGGSSGDSGPIKGEKQATITMIPIADRYNLPPEFPIAVAIHESGLGTNMHSPGNNHYGWFQWETFAKGTAPGSYAKYGVSGLDFDKNSDCGHATTGFCRAAAAALKKHPEYRHDYVAWAEDVQGASGQFSTLPSEVDQAKALVKKYKKYVNPKSSGGSSSSPSSNGLINPIPGFGNFSFDKGIDCTAPVGSAILAPADCTIAGYQSDFWKQQPLVLYKFDHHINGAPSQYWFVSEQIDPVSTHIGRQFKQGDTVATFAAHGTAIEIGWGSASTGDMRYAPIEQHYGQQHTGWGWHFYNFLSIGHGSPQAATPGSGGGGGTSNDSGDIFGTATAAAFATELQFPSLEETSEAILLKGGKSLMNDQPLFPFVEQLANASIRNFQSLPNGNFFAFFPDYFGNYFHRKPYWRIADIEILDGKIELTDDSLATHVYVVGDTIPFDGINIVDKLMSGGVVTVFNAFQGKNWIINEQGAEGNTTAKPSKQNQQTALDFLKKFGARPLLIEDPLIRSPYFEAFMAIQKFQLAWSRQFLTTFQLTFMPELYPGGIASFEGHGIQCYIDSVTHSWDYESGFTTTAQFSAPARYGGGSELAQGMIRGSSTPTVLERPHK